MKKWLLLLPLMAAGVSVAQAPRSAYHLDGYVYGHELNPAFQPESNYFSLPVLGNTSVSIQSTMGLDDLIYKRKDGSQTTFMARGTIDKADLLDKVGNAFKTFTDKSLTLISLGRRVDEKKYQTLSASIRITEDVRVGKGMFDMLKDLENRTYDLSDNRINVDAYAELAAGESWRLDDRWTLGLKGKLLVGLAHLDMDVDHMSVNFDKNRWTAQGRVDMNASGLAYKTEEKEYKSEGRGMYESVTGLGLGSLWPSGVGLAVDFGATFKADSRWTLSAAVRDLGVMAWLKNHKARNMGKPFSFDGFSDICLEEPDKEYADEHPGRESVDSQVHRLQDDLIDLAHLETDGTNCLVRMLGATIHAGAKYQYDAWTAGALLTSRIRGNLSWVEGRINVTYRPVDQFSVTIAPAYSTTGFAMGGMLNYRFKNDFELHLGSDALCFWLNKQGFPTNLCGSLQLGMAFVVK